MDNLRVAIADDHALYSEALEMLLQSTDRFQINVAGVVQNGRELLEFLENRKVELILLDLNMPIMGGLEALPVIKDKYPGIKVIVVTMYEDAKFIKDVLNKFHGDGYFLKTNPFDELLDAIEAVMSDDVYLCSGLKVFPKDLVNGDKQFEDEFQLRHRLTPRETQILHMISHAKSNKEIADELFISDQTVMVHRKNIMRKLNLSNTAGLIKFALDHDLA